jgi:hypothetical protein
LQFQQQYPSIALVLPTNKSDKTDNQKSSSDLKATEDVSTTLSQQEELSVKGTFNYFYKYYKNEFLFFCPGNQDENSDIY